MHVVSGSKPSARARWSQVRHVAQNMLTQRMSTFHTREAPVLEGRT